MECQRGQNCQTTKSHCQMVTAFSNQHNPLSNVHSQSSKPFSNGQSFHKPKVHYQLEQKNLLSNGQSILKTEIHYQKQKSILNWSIHSQNINSFSNGQSIFKAEIHSQMVNPLSKEKSIIKRPIHFSKQKFIVKRSIYSQKQKVDSQVPLSNLNHVPRAVTDEGVAEKLQAVRV